MDTAKILKDIIKATKLGGKEIVKRFGTTLQYVEKRTVADLRSEADEAAEAAIIKYLRKKYPSFAIHSEEAGRDKTKAEYTFVVDPLDGTNNFSLGIPWFSSSIGLYHNNEIIAGVVTNPILKTTYSAAKGQGAFLNGEPLHVNTEIDVHRSTVAYLTDYEAPKDHQAKIKQRLQALDAKRITNLWSPALEHCMIAQGKTEGLISEGLENYDYAAGYIIAQEAGAFIRELPSPSWTKRQTFVVASTEAIANTLESVARG